MEPVQSYCTANESTGASIISQHFQHLTKTMTTGIMNLDGPDHRVQLSSTWSHEGELWFRLPREGHIVRDITVSAPPFTRVRLHVFSDIVWGPGLTDAQGTCVIPVALNILRIDYHSMIVLVKCDDENLVTCAATYRILDSRDTILRLAVKHYRDRWYECPEFSSSDPGVDQGQRYSWVAKKEDHEMQHSSQNIRV